MNKSRILTFALAIGFSIFFVSTATSQNGDGAVCKIIRNYDNGSRLVKIGDETFLAISKDIERNLLKVKVDLENTQKQIALKDSMIENFDCTLAAYDSTIRHMRDYIGELESILAGYKGLLRDYKRLKASPVTLELGLGATGSAKKPAILMGTGIYKFRIWGQLQENNSGAFIGSSFPLF